MTSTAPGLHLSDQLPWKDIQQFVTFQTRPPKNELRFHVSESIDPEGKSRGEAIVNLAYRMACCIHERAEEETRKRVPKPSASEAELRDAGVVDGQLFPTDIPGSEELQSYAQWKHGDIPWEKPQFILDALYVREDPFDVLPPFAFLAQHTLMYLGFLFTMSKYNKGSITMSAGGFNGWVHSCLATHLQDTMRNYFLLNLLLAFNETNKLTDDRVLSLLRSTECECKTCSGEPGSPRTVHQELWTTGDADGMHRYIERCFNVMVVWYAIARLAADQPVQKGADREPSFGFCHLFGIAMSALEALGDGLTLPLPLWQRGLPERTFKEYELVDPSLPPPAPYMCPPPSQRCMMVKLSREVHHRIMAFLPRTTLVSLARTCRALHPPATELLFATSALKRFEHLWEYDSYRKRLMNGTEEQHESCRYVYEERKELFDSIRSAALQQPVPEPASSGQLLSGYPSRLSEWASRLTQLRTLTLKVVVKVDEARDAYKVVDTITDSFPHLKTLTLTVEHTPLRGKNTWKTRPLGMGGKPSTLSLEKLTLSFVTDICCDPPRDESPLYAAPLLNPFAATVTNLDLTIRDYDLDSPKDLPKFPNLHTLSLSTNIPGKQVEKLLRHSFSTTKKLTLEYKRDYDERRLSALKFVDLAEILPTVESVTFDHGYAVRGLPPSAEMLHEHFPLIKQDCAVKVRTHPSPNVRALKFFLPNYEKNRTAYAELYPNVEYIELPSNRWRKIKEFKAEGMPMLKEAKMFKKLDTLIVHVEKLSDRPLRRDFPEFDDGLDEEQKEMAKELFQEIETLQVVGLAGLPSPKDNPIYMVPRRFWRREGDEVRMVGPEVLKWHFD